MAFVMAFASISYELVIAQVMTSLFGGTVYQYSLSLGIYMLALGVGSIAMGDDSKDPLKKFLHVETCLAAMGAVGPIAVLVFETYFFSGALFAYLWLAILGFLSGIEIPLLILLATKHSLQKDRVEKSVLVWDYAGAFLGCILFPLITLPLLGISYGSLFCSIANISMTILIMLFTQKKSKSLKWASLAFMVSTALIWSVEDMSSELLKGVY